MSPAQRAGGTGARATGEQRRKDWTVLELLRWTANHFAECGIAQPRLDAECLLAAALDCDRLQLYLDFEKPVEADERARFREFVRARASDRMPVAYLTGLREFWSMPLVVNPDVLIPRPETEMLVEALLARLAPDARARVIDVGTGSGAIALALARERPGLEITASDCSAPALKVARENARRLGLEARVRFLEGDLLGPVVGERFDVVVANPPYVGRGEASGLEPELRHEPELALFGGEQGSELSRALIRAAPAVLAKGGTLAIEMDPRQLGDLEIELVRAGFGIEEPRRDLAGRPRVLVASWRGEGGD